MKKLLVLILGVVLLSCSGSKHAAIGGKSFCFNDSYYRNIKLKFNKDFSYTLANETTMALAFTSLGTWKRIGEDTLLLKSNGFHESNPALNNAPLTGQRIDVEIATADKSYIFPVINLDTFYVKGNSYLLKGYQFNKCN